MKTRNSSIELLRILAILGVVVLHYNGNVAFGLAVEGSLSHTILLAFESLCLCAVNTFVLISGYFLCQTNQRRWVKVLQLLVQVILFGAVRYVISAILSGGGFSPSSLIAAMIPNNWFVFLYLTLYILSPYLNLVLERLDRRQMTVLLVIMLILFSLWPTGLDMVREVTGLSFVGMYPLSNQGNVNGYTIVQFGLMYLIGAYLRRFGDTLNIRGWVPPVVFGGSVLVLTAWQMVLPGGSRDYSNPLIILMAVCLFLIFSRVSMQSGPVNRLAQGAFACYLLHDVFLPYLGIGRILTMHPAVLVLHVLVCAAGIYLICFAIDFVYGLVSRPVFDRVGKALSRFDGWISPSKE